MRRSILRFALLGAIVGPTTRMAQSPRPLQGPAVTAAIFRAVLDSVYGVIPDSVVVVDSTLMFRLPARGSRRGRLFEFIPADLLKSLAAASAQRTPTTRLPLPRPAIVLDAPARTELFRGGVAAGWAQFHRRYPRARLFLGLSPAAFNPDGTQAAVYYEYHCGPRCGAGKLAVLARGADAQWNVRSTVTIWIS
jgi:hypothetical protein